MYCPTCSMFLLVSSVFVILHNGLELIESVVPHFAEGLDKLGDLFHSFCVDLIAYLAAALLLVQQLTFGKYLEVL